ncbi:hypothetical protein J6590_097890 [Homalodisca vitripennis]|nr:hypothetical protein J6590_097890 [Homalodisca vitripennis]
MKPPAFVCPVGGERSSIGFVARKTAQACLQHNYFDFGAFRTRGCDNAGVVAPRAGFNLMVKIFHVPRNVLRCYALKSLRPSYLAKPRQFLLIA